MTLAAHILGAFYIFAGIMALRAMALDRLMDMAIAAIDIGSKPDPRERLKSLWLTFGAALTLASGVALFILSALAPGLFVANLAAQTGYLIWAERALPPEDATEKIGRMRTINAALLYAGATVFAVWASSEYSGPLFGMNPNASLAVEFVLIVVVTAGAYVYFFRPGKRRLGLGAMGGGEGDYDDRPYDAADGENAIDLDGDSWPPKALRVMPEYQCWPVWNDFTGNNIDPSMLGLSAALLERLDRWDQIFQATYNSDDPAESGLADEDWPGFLAEGEAIIDEIRKEWGGTVVSNIRRTWGAHSAARG